MITANYIGNTFGNIAKVLASAFSSRVSVDGGVTEATECLRTRIRDLKTKGLWDKASAVWLPHGVKANKFYAVKGGSGADLGFTRAGTRTRKAATYLETVATGLPALDYTGATCPSLSLEPARTNLLLWSEAFDNAAWTKTNVTATANAIAGPENLSTADAIFETATANVVHIVPQTISKAGSALKYTGSIFVKPNGRDWVRLTISSGSNGAGKRFNITTGVVGTTQIDGTGFTLDSWNIVPSANGFYRIDVTVTSDATTAIVLNAVLGTADGVESYTGDVTKGVYIYGAQLEQASYATSYIKTEAATVSRVADAVTALTGVSNLIGQTEGTLYFEGSSFADGTVKSILSVSDGTINNRVLLYFDSSNAIFANIQAAGVAQANISTGFTTNTNYKIAITYQNNKVALFVNGVKIGEDLIVTVPACQQVQFANGGGSSPNYSNGKAWAISKTAISDAEAILWTQ